MTRITGFDAANLMEAYFAVYAPQELTEEQVWEEVEVWVNSLIEEGYDLSEYTWEEMYDAYIEEQGGRMSGPERREQQAQIRANRPVPRVTPTTRTQTGQGSRPIGSTTRRGGGVQAQTALPKKPSPRDLGRQVQQNAPKNEPMVLRGPDGRPLGSRPSTPAARTTPTPSGTSPRPSTPTPSGTAPRPSTPADRPAPTSSGTAPRPSTPAARPSLRSDIEDLRRMRAASIMRQQGRNMPDGSISTGDSLKPKPAPVPAATSFNPNAPRVVPTTPRPTAGAAAVARPAATSFNPNAPRVVPTTPRPTAGASAVKRGADGTPMGQKRKEPLWNSVELFDIVKGHLMSEGFADTEEAATVIMANMSEEWKQSIVEGDALQNTIKTLEGKRDKMNAQNPGSANVSRGGKQSVGAATYKAYQRLRGV
jgi:hypothetical protein